MKKIRLDQLMVEKNLSESRSQAQRYIMAGQVRVAGQVELKPSTAVAPDALVEVEESLKYVSRGAQKLEAALEAFGLQKMDGWVCADVGASTGGFTDCMLAHGARRVYAIDVGHNILHWKLRTDERVVVMENTNARFVESLPEALDFISIDVSFISLETILPVVKTWLKTEGGQVVALIKPQFEAGRREAARGKGVIRDPEVHRLVLNRVLHSAAQQDWGISGLIRSPITGPKGNVE
ncbi:MAG: TlyA family RNA methyltransferase, partial [Anaerolineaceae bacterium]